MWTTKQGIFKENVAVQNKIKKHTVWTTIFRAFVFLSAFVGLGYVVCLIFKHLGLWQKINSIEKLRKVVECGGVFSSLLFMLFQFLQTTFLQIPSIIVTMAGVLIFPKWKAFLLSYIAIMLGSLFNFWLGRKAGRKFLYWIAGETSAEKWIKIISECKYVFFLMMVFPMFPDDILCVVAGITNMSFTFFFVTNVLCRAVGIGCTVLFGSGAVIPFAGWGLVVWVIIAVALAVLFYMSVKYQSKIDEIITKFVNKIKKKKLKNK